MKEIKNYIRKKNQIVKKKHEFKIINNLCFLFGSFFFNRSE